MAEERKIKNVMMSFPKQLSLLAIILMLSTSYSLHAQTCTQEDALKKIGSWKRYDDFMHPGNNYTPDMKTEIFSRIEKFRQVISKAYTPKGMEVGYERQIYGTALYKSGTVTYDIWGQMLQYGCDTKTHQLVLADESSDHFYVFANHFGSNLMFDTSMHVGRLYVALMPYRVGSIKGTDLFQSGLVRVNERMVIVSREGQLPYTPLTRKQFLVAFKRKLQNEENSIVARSMLGTKTEAQKADAEKYWTSRYDPKIKIIDDYLSTATDDDLNQTAFVKDMVDFKKFITEKEGGRMPVIVNTGYFNPNQKPYYPQFIMLFWQWDDGEGPGGGLLRPVAPDMNVCCKISKYFKDSMEQNIDVDAIRQLLDK